MSILDPTPTEKGSSEDQLHAQTDATNRRAQAGRGLTSAFLETSMTILLRQVEPDDVVNRQDQLQLIFQKALDVAGRLQKQLTVLKCLYLKDLKDEPFSYGSELL
jgi:hypothetical protein